MESSRTRPWLLGSSRLTDWLSLALASKVVALSPSLINLPCDINLWPLLRNVHCLQHFIIMFRAFIPVLKFICLSFASCRTFSVQALCDFVKLTFVTQLLTVFLLQSLWLWPSIFRCDNWHVSHTWLRQPACQLLAFWGCETVLELGTGRWRTDIQTDALHSVASVREGHVTVQRRCICKRLCWRHGLMKCSVILIRL